MYYRPAFAKATADKAIGDVEKKGRVGVREIQNLTPHNSHLSASEAFFDNRSFSEGCSEGGSHLTPHTSCLMPLFNLSPRSCFNYQILPPFVFSAISDSKKNIICSRWTCIG